MLYQVMRGPKDESDAVSALVRMPGSREREREIALSIYNRGNIV